MSDEQLTQAPEDQDTPAFEGAPDAGTRTEEESINWEKRFKDLQPELTKAQQEAARLRAIDEGLRDPQRAAEILQEYGFAVGDDGSDSEDEESDDEVYRDPRVDALLQEREQERETAILNDVSGHIDRLLSEAKVDVPPRFKQAILSEAWLRGNGAQISPEVTESVVKEWVDEYKQLERQAGDRYIASKRAPHVSPGGTGATEEVLPLDASHKDRVRYMAERYQLGQQS